MDKPTCSIKQCESPVLGRGWCNKHYLRWRKHGDPLREPVRGQTGDPCKIEGCGRLITPHSARGMCILHYGRWRRGYTEDTRKSRSGFCAAEGCRSEIGEAGSRGLCGPHYRKTIADPERARETNRKVMLGYAKRTPGELERDFLKCWPSGVKMCIRCGQEFPPSGFSLNLRRLDGKLRRCKQNGCAAAHIREKKAANLRASLSARGLPVDACAYCLAAPIEHADHFWPLKLGGPDAPSNLVGACARCNINKSYHDPFEWLEHNFPDRTDFFRGIFPPRRLALAG